MFLPVIETPRVFIDIKADGKIELPLESRNNLFLCLERYSLSSKFHRIAIYARIYISAYDLNFSWSTIEKLF